MCGLAHVVDDDGMVIGNTSKIAASSPLVMLSEGDHPVCTDMLERKTGDTACAREGRSPIELIMAI
jgi:hypothetical protein